MRNTWTALKAIIRLWLRGPEPAGCPHCHGDITGPGSWDYTPHAKGCPEAGWR